MSRLPSTSWRMAPSARSTTTAPAPIRQSLLAPPGSHRLPSAMRRRDSSKRRGLVTLLSWPSIGPWRSIGALRHVGLVAQPLGVPSAGLTAVGRAAQDRLAHGTGHLVRTSRDIAHTAVLIEE